MLHHLGYRTSVESIDIIPELHTLHVRLVSGDVLGLSDTRDRQVNAPHALNRHLSSVHMVQCLLFCESGKREQKAERV